MFHVSAEKCDGSAAQFAQQTICESRHRTNNASHDCFDYHQAGESEIANSVNGVAEVSRPNKGFRLKAIGV
jgi:hypothetical protein